MAGTSRSPRATSWWRVVQRTCSSFTHLCPASLRSTTVLLEFGPKDFGFSDAQIIPRQLGLIRCPNWWVPDPKCHKEPLVQLSTQIRSLCRPNNPALHQKKLVILRQSPTAGSRSPHPSRGRQPGTCCDQPVGVGRYTGWYLYFMEGDAGFNEGWHLGPAQVAAGHGCVFDGS